MRRHRQRHWRRDRQLGEPYGVSQAYMTDSAADNVEQLLTQFGPHRKVRFAALQPHRRLIEELRGRGASFETIFHVLKHKGVETCASRVRDFCREVLQERTTSDTHSKRPTRRGASAPKPVLPPHTQLPPPQPPPTSSAQGSQAGPRIAHVEFIQEPKI